jgi:hypothetical protein
MLSGYVAGGSVSFFGSMDNADDRETVKASRFYDPETVKADIQSRLSFEDDVQYKSMLAFCAPIDDGAKNDQVISISPRILPWEVNTNDDHKAFPGGAKNFDAANKAFRLDTIHYGEDIRAIENMEFISQVRTST